MAGKNITFIPGLFKPANIKITKVDASDLFVSPEVLRECSSLCAAHPSGRPNYVLSDPNIDQIIDLSDEVLDDIAKVQMQREKRESEADKLEEKKTAELEAVDQQIRKPLDRQVDQIFNKRSFFVKKSCPVVIPFKSNLTHAEHETYLRAFVRFRIRPAITPVEAAEHEQYMRLQQRVYEEQSYFNQFSHQVATLQLPAYNTVPDTVTSYLDLHVQYGCRHSLRYKQLYIQEQQVPICPLDPTKRLKNLSFTHLGHLLSLGTVPWFKVPNPCSQYTLQLDDSVARLQPPSPSDTGGSTILFKTPVSEDNNAAYLAQQHQANIVISTSALKVLTDNYGPNFDKEWDIPVVVKSFSVKDADGNESCHRVVFIDKPMVKKTWTPIEKKQLFYKKSAKASMTEIKKYNYFRLNSPLIFRYLSLNDGHEREDAARKTKEQAEYNDDHFDFTAVADNDCFGVEAHNSPPLTHMTHNTKKKMGKIDKPNPKCGKNRKKYERSLKDTQKAKHTEEENCLMPDETVDNERGGANKSAKESKVLSPTRKICDGKTSGKTGIGTNGNKIAINTNLDIKVETSTNPETPKWNHKPGNSGSSNVLDSLLDMQDVLLKPSLYDGSKLDGQKEEAGPAHVPRPWAGTLKTDWSNHNKPQSCDLWTGTNVHYQLFSLDLGSSQPNESSQSLRVLVRHNLHGLSRFKFQNGTSKAYVVYSKPENQAYFGCEVNTLSEITQQWIQLLVRPNTTLLQVRVCESSGQILIAEEKDLAYVVKEGKQPHIAFSPIAPLSVLHSIFTATTALSTGHYLLHHDLKTRAFVLLMKAVDSNILTHLHTLNLHQCYAANSATTRPYTTPPWLAIDTHILTPFHLKHFKIPATFPMNNPTKKLTKKDQKRIKEKVKKKKRIQDLDKPKEDD